MEIRREIRAELQELVVLMRKLQETYEQGHVWSTSPSKSKPTENIATEMEKGLILKTRAAGQEMKLKKEEEEKTLVKQGTAEVIQKTNESRGLIKMISNPTRVKVGLAGMYELKKQRRSFTFKQLDLVEKITDSIEKVLFRVWVFNIKDFQRSRLRGTEGDLRASDVRPPG